MTSVMPEPDPLVQTRIVHLILSKDTEQALSLLSSFYRITSPAISVGTIKGKRKTAYAVYVPREEKIYAMNSEIFCNPFVILHEFYHHLRSRGGTHRGTEKHADAFAMKFIESYNNYAKRSVRYGSGENREIS